MKPTDALPHPSDWRASTVGEAVEIKRGISWSKDQEHVSPREGAIPVLRIGNVQERMKLSDLIYISGLKDKAVEKKRATAGWSIMVGSNGNRKRVGNAVLIREDTDYLFASFLIAARPKEESNITPDYFYRWLTSEPVQAYLSASSEGTTGLNNLSHSFFRAMAIPYPSPEEQAAIARILDAVDTAIERTREAAERARMLQTSMLADVFDRMKADRRRLGEFTIDVRYGTSQAASERGWGIPTLRIPNVVGDQLTLDDLVYVDLKPADVARLALSDGDLLLVRTNGNPNYVGRSAVFHAPDDRAWVYASYLIRVRLNAELLPEYVNVFLGVERGRRELLRRVTTSAGNHNINSNSIRLLSIPVPQTKDEQERVVKIARSCRAYVHSIQQKLTALTELKKSLMHDLLTGKVRVNNLSLEGVASS